MITRLIEKLSDRSGKQFFVENIGGGGGNIAMGRVAKMPPDGYTLLMVNPSYVVNPTLYRDHPYRFEKDFDPVSLAVLTTLVIAVHPSVPAQTLQELVALIKANPRKFSYASPGPGPRVIWSAKSSAFRSVLTSCMCRSTAAGRRSVRRSAGTRRFALPRHPRPRSR